MNASQISPVSGPTITVALTPAAPIPIEGCTVVAVDILRATTAICAAFQAGAEEIVPLDTLEALEGYRGKGYLLAAERGGKKIGDAHYGNSPTEYLRHDLHGQRLAYSTTNGTRCILRGDDESDNENEGKKGRITSEEEAKKAFALIKDRPFEVTSVTKKNGTEAPPRLFDLTSLQVECNKKFSFSAEETLK